jgi:6-pyruvoyltetrahydropterin/6-carboxytetrahydropterin synthase
MYQLAVKRDFVAQHYLIGGDWGPENELHSHHYQLEVILEGKALNQHGYLLDIVDLEAKIEELIARYRDTTLNDLPEFDGLNPSLEHFTRIFSDELAANFMLENLSQMTIKIWENDIAWATYQRELSQ